LSGTSALESLLRRDRLMVLAGLAGVTALAWGYVVTLARDMTVMSAMDMPLMPWTSAHFAFMFAMWVVMMAGMMLPSVAPTLLLYANIARKSAAHAAPLAPVGWFAVGYMLAWSLFSLFATAAQWGLEAMALMTPVMAIANRRLAGLLLIGIGVYQWLPVKGACLSNCRSPLSFMQRAGGFQASVRGAVRLGVLHGFYCIGCCWALMLLLFVGGVMNLLWIAILMMAVLAEKVLPGGAHFSRLSGAAALAAGAVFLFAGTG
jgi:predicted metal-binding membrane protein